MGSGYNITKRGRGILVDHGGVVVLELRGVGILVEHGGVFIIKIRGHIFV